MRLRAFSTTVSSACEPSSAVSDALRRADVAGDAILERPRGVLGKYGREDVDLAGGVAGARALPPAGPAPPGPALLCAAQPNPQQKPCWVAKKEGTENSVGPSGEHVVRACKTPTGRASLPLWWGASKQAVKRSVFGEQIAQEHN